MNGKKGAQILYRNKNIENKKIRVIDGIKVQTYETEISSFNTLSAEAGTTGYMGGGSKKGGRTFIKIIDVANSDISVERNADGKGFTLRAGGDSELDTLIDSLDFIVSILKRQKSEKVKEYQNAKEQMKSGKKEDGMNSPATQKQVIYVNSLLKKSGYILSMTEITKEEAKELIDGIKENRLSVEEMAEKYRNILKKIN